jgi:D-alanyl-lipoteichoic acid acyltransferase DltB (MBOAT superfamily)
VLADMLATRLVDPVFGSPSAHGATDVLLAVYAYGAQIYCDFSGYTDMATGLALLLGFQFPRNFNSPYTATSLQDFWRRWHMTLSRWLRDYLYVPLGGNRRGEWRTRLNLVLTMLLGGLWHGAAWNFVIWGGIHGTALVVGRSRRAKAGPGPAAISAAQPTPATRGAPGSGTVLEAPPEPAPTEVREPPSRRAGPLGPLPAWLVTQHVVLLAWVFFRAPDLHTVVELAGSLWSGAPSTLASRTLLLAVLSAYAVQWVPESWRERIRGTVDGWGTVRLALLLASAVLVATALMPREGVAPFIYFRF